MSEKMELKTKDDFIAEVIKSELPVMVDFWAPWCMPCQEIAPHVEELAKKYEGKIYVYKINIDELRDIAQEYDVMSIPNLIFFKDGKQVDQMVGSGSIQKIEKFITKVIKK